MTNYEFGDVVLVAFPQSGTPVRKRRPALVMLDIGDADIVLAPITTREARGRVTRPSTRGRRVAYCVHRGYGSPR